MLSFAYATEPTPLKPDDLQFFETKIRPLFADRCYKCHSHTATKVKSGLYLDSRDGVLHGGSSGPAIVPGKPDDSLLVQAIRYTDPDLKMPPVEHGGGQLGAAEIAALTEWVRRGAPDPRTATAVAGAKDYGPAGRDHWAFQPLKKPAIPAVKNTAWVQSPVDRFVLARLESAGLAPSPPADKRTLIRRVTFDLTGLPPTEPEVQRFLADNSPEAFARVVDRLLASPHYGERWARYWMDVARYSDTQGDPAPRKDQRFPDAWTYRDYLIASFNSDKPYNRFIVEQLAADRLLAADTAKAKAAGQPPPADQQVLAALGFLRLGNQHNGRRNDIIDDRIDVTTKAFLGLTVSCARCHDHKFDPIPTQDYYSLYGVFANTAEPASVFQEPTLQTKLPDTPARRDYLQKQEVLAAKSAELQEQFRQFRRAHERDPARRRELVRVETALEREIGDFEVSHPGAPARAHVLTDVPKPKDYPVLLRGEVQNAGAIVPRRFLAALSPDPAKRPEWKQGSGRLELAQAIADPQNPMTARVLVNRIWQQHFGAGFVSSPDDLGHMGGAPTHPALLDWLATQFIAQGWSIKQLHRAILLSSTYQQGSLPNPAGLAADPDNHLLWHYAVRRLDFEEIYDSLLAVAGTLNPAIGGRPVIPLSPGVGKRRALYFLVDRRAPPELFTQFDFPNPDTPSGRRATTTVPQQALFLMNSPLVTETARKLTRRPEFTDFDRDEDRVAALYLAILQRPPTDQEVALGLAYVHANPGGTSFATPAESPARQAAIEKRRAERAELTKNRRTPYNPLLGIEAEYGVQLDAWTKLAQALFQTSEAMFID